jgi:hypothetical protein
VAKHDPVEDLMNKLGGTAATSAQSFQPKVIKENIVDVLTNREKKEAAEKKKKKNK